jgi:hypothetical protein
MVPLKDVLVDALSLLGVSVNHGHDEVHYLGILDPFLEVLAWVVHIFPIVLEVRQIKQGDSIHKNLSDHTARRKYIHRGHH